MFGQLYMHKYKHKNRQSGFSLLELMATVAIGGILLAIGLPSFVNLIKTNRLATQTNSVLTALHLARNESINRGHNIRVLTITGDTDWAAGWQVRLDVNNDGITDAEDTVLRSFDAIEKATLVGDTNDVIYQSSGFVEAVNSITLTAYECTGDDIRVIDVKLSGLVSSSKQTCP